jgi:hypothetical protein
MRALAVTLGVALLGGAVLVAAPPAYAAGTPSITDAYSTRRDTRRAPV